MMLIQVSIATVMLVVGAMGFMGSIFTSQIMARQAKEMNRANAALVTIIEEFRNAAINEFDVTLVKYAGDTTYERKKDTDVNGNKLLIDVVDRKTTVATTEKVTDAPIAMTPTKTDLERAEQDLIKAKTVYAKALTDYEKAISDAKLARKLAGGDTVKLAAAKTTFDAVTTTKTQLDAAHKDYNAKLETYEKYQLIARTGDTLAEPKTVTQDVDLNGNTRTAITTTKIADTTVLSTDIVDLNLVASIADDAKVTTNLLLDETRMDPPMDLNGDGDALDTNVDPKDLTAGVFRVRISWTGNRTKKFVETTTILARNTIGATFR